MKIQVLRRKMSKIFFASIYEQKNVYYQVKNATFIGKSQFLSTLHSKSTFKSFQVFIPVTIRIWDLYRVKIWVSKPPWDPLGGANCHGKKELEPFRVPGEKQQFKVPAPSRSKVHAFSYSNFRFFAFYMYKASQLSGQSDRLIHRT